MFFIIYDKTLTSVLVIPFPNVLLITPVLSWPKGQKHVSRSVALFKSPSRHGAYVCWFINLMNSIDMYGLYGYVYHKP